MMQAASLGAIDAGKIVAGIRIAREAGTSVKSRVLDSSLIL